MLIGLCGGICSGKNTIADFLIENHQFTRLHLPEKPVTPLLEDPEDSRKLLGTYSDHPSPQKESFQDVEALDTYVAKKWRDHFVTTDIWDDATLDLLLRRPYFLLVSVDAPVSLRWKRFSDRCRLRSLPPPSLETFVLWSDRHLYNPTSQTETLTLSHLLSRAHLRLINTSTTLPSLHTSLNHLNLLDPTRLRPSWDQYFMRLASLAAQRSNCMRRRVGCVVVGLPSRRVISTGYNGTPRGITNCNEGGCARCNGTSTTLTNGTVTHQGGGANLSTCLCLHAEENALLEAGRERISQGDGAVLYCDTCPCLTCAVKITQVGIREVLYSQRYHMDGETARILKEGGVHLRQFSPPKEGLVSLEMGVEGLDLGDGEE